MKDPWLEKKFLLVKKFGWFAMGGGALLLLAFLVGEGALQTAAIITGFLAIGPWLFYVYVMTVWHWKHRYRGRHSDLWGAILLVETSGWFKIIYWFRHILPDWYGEGRYSS